MGNRTPLGFLSPDTGSIFNLNLIFAEGTLSIHRSFFFVLPLQHVPVDGDSGNRTHAFTLHSLEKYLLVCICQIFILRNLNPLVFLHIILNICRRKSYQITFLYFQLTVEYNICWCDLFRIRCVFLVHLIEVKNNICCRILVRIAFFRRYLMRIYTHGIATNIFSHDC